MTARYHCEACGWDGDTPDTWEEDGPLGIWIMRVCSTCGTEVFATIVPRENGEAG
jgi:hypothetical protein